MFLELPALLKKLERFGAALVRNRFGLFLESTALLKCILFFADVITGQFEEFLAVLLG